MPFISIKSWPRDEATRRKAVERVQEAFLEVWGCPAEYLTICCEEVQPEDWEAQVVQGEIEAKPDTVMIRNGVKTENLLKMPEA